MAGVPDHSWTLNYVVFMVADEAYCLWSHEDIAKQSLEYLDSIDARFFAYQAKTNLKLYNYKKYRQHAALALRIAFSHGLETLFSLIGASLQAPYCPQAWTLQCDNTQLYDVIGRIGNLKRLPTMLKAKPVDWQAVSEVAHMNLVLHDKQEERNIKRSFANLWHQWAEHFLAAGFRQEYNSIKHGFRIKPGGFSLAIGVEDRPGMRAAPEEMRLLAKGEFGSSFPEVDRIGDSRQHIVLKRTARNWDPEDMAWSLELIAMSITNLIASLKVLNGFDATKVRYSWPTHADTFSEPWKRSRAIGATYLQRRGLQIPAQYITPYTSKQLVALYNRGEVRHTKPINIARRQ